MQMYQVFGQVHTLPLPDGSLARITGLTWDDWEGSGYAAVALSVVFLERRMILFSWVYLSQRDVEWSIALSSAV